MPKLLALSLLAALAYPPAPRGDTVDDYHGVKVPAPYRWMEDLDSSQVKQWIDAENKLTFSYLDKLPEREALRKRLTELWNYPRTDAPERAGGKLFYRRNAGLQRQAVLYVAPGNVVLDPNQLSPDGSLAVTQAKPSPDGRWLAYSTAQGGSDVRDLHVRDLRSGRDLPEIVPRVKFSGISWTRDSRGFVYERFRGTEKSAAFAQENLYQQVWYHPLHGADRLLHENPADAHESFRAGVSDDGRWLFVAASHGTTNTSLAVAALGDPLHPRFGAPLQKVAAEDAIHEPLGNVGARIIMHTTEGAPNGRIVAVDIGDADHAHWKTIVPETKDAIEAVYGPPILVNGVVALVRLVDVQSRLELYELSGKPLGEVALPEPGSVQTLRARNDDKDFFFEFTSFLRPRTVYRYDFGKRAIEPFMPPPQTFDASQYETRELFYSSKDGTRVPLFVTARKGLPLDGTHPAQLYGYGGFNISIQPSYSPSIAAWLEAGAVYAVANIRGGGEYGEAWHRAGTREKKQNVFDDFIAAAEFLVAQRYTSPQHLAIRGGSNGGLLVGAVANQRPDLFAVALPAVGVMDMLRYQKFTGGAAWAEDYGSSDDPPMIAALRAYSPLQNVKPGCHPATLVTTADRDDRVVPSHSFQYAAALQAAQTCDKPVLIRVETAGSHGYRPTDRVIAEIADIWSFALANTR